MNVQVVDIGGSHVKVLATGEDEPRKLSSGPKMTPHEVAASLAAGAYREKYLES